MADNDTVQTAAEETTQPETTVSYSAGDIRKMVEDKLNSTAFLEMATQQEDDFNLLTLEEYQAKSGYQSYTSPAPRNDFLKVFHGINKAELTWQILTPDDAPQADREAASRGEALLTGILDRGDRALRKIGEPPLRSALSWYACARGVAGLKCLIYSNESHETEISIRAIDPMHMAWESGVDGLVWAAYKYSVSKGEAKARWGVDLGGETATVIDFFDANINAVVLSAGTVEQSKGDEFIKPPESHDIGHVPVWIGFASGMPTVFTSTDEPTLKHRASSVYSSSRNVYEPRNKQVSFIMDTAEKSVAGTLVYESETGQKQIQGDPFGAWQVVLLAKGEKLAPLQPPEVPAASGVLLGVLNQDKQESTVPFPIGYGLDPQAHSGAALAMMNDNMRSVYGPFTSLLEDAYHWLAEEILGQFKAKGQKIFLQGFDAAGKFFEMDATPEDVQDNWYLSIKCEPKLPRDEAADIQMAMAASTPGPDGDPLVSKLTAREKIVRLQNPDAEAKRIEAEVIARLIMRMPNIQIRRVANELLAKGDKEGAMELLASIPSPTAQDGGRGPIAGQGAAPAPAPAPGPAPMPGPQGAGGIPPEVQNVIMAASQALGIPPEQVMAMGPERVQQLMQARAQAPGG